MEAITLKLPEDLHTLLTDASMRRGLSKSAVVREALELSLRTQSTALGAAERWVTQWQGRLRLPEPGEVEDADPRLAHLIRKHVR